MSDHPVHLGNKVNQQCSIQTLETSQHLVAYTQPAVPLDRGR